MTRNVTCSEHQNWTSVFKTTPPFFVLGIFYTLFNSQHVSGYLGRHHRRLLSNNFIRRSRTVVIHHPCYYLVAFQWSNVYRTAFLEDRPWGHLQTYRTQTDHHGLAIGTPGAAQYTAPDHLRWALCRVQLTYLQQRRLPSPPVRIWTKGLPNSCFVATLLPQYAPEVRNLEDIGCPALRRLLTGQDDQTTPSTLLKALSLAAWVEAHPTSKPS